MLCHQVTKPVATRFRLRYSPRWSARPATLDLVHVEPRFEHVPPQLCLFEFDEADSDTLYLQFPMRQVDTSYDEQVVSFVRPTALGGPGHADRVTLVRWRGDNDTQRESQSVSDHLDDQPIDRDEL